MSTTPAMAPSRLIASRHREQRQAGLNLLARPYLP